jgi:hypothetical protein
MCIVGFGCATRPCAARTRIFRLINTQNWALLAQRPSQLRSLCVSDFIEKIRLKSIFRKKKSAEKSCVEFNNAIAGVTMKTKCFLCFLLDSKIIIAPTKKDCAVCQWWANLDQAPEDLDKNIFRDLSPTPIP